MSDAKVIGFSVGEESLLGFAIKLKLWFLWEDWHALHRGGS